jgi:hypothetical protein
MKFENESENEDVRIVTVVFEIGAVEFLFNG